MKTANPSSKLSMPFPGTAFQDGVYVGVCTNSSGTPYVLILLTLQTAGGLKWHEAMSWAKSLDADLPNRSEAALVFGHLRQLLPDEQTAHWTKCCWQWTNETRTQDEKYAWMHDTAEGCQDWERKDKVLRAFAVRRLPLNASSFIKPLPPVKRVNKRVHAIAMAEAA